LEDEAREDARTDKGDDSLANEAIRIANIETVLENTVKLFIQRGIQNTTREMIARASGVSRRSTERYFPSKTECVVRAAEWYGNKLNKQFETRNMFDGTHQASEILMAFFQDLRKLLVEDSRIYAIYAEFKAYLYRNSDNREVDYRRFMDAVGARRELEHIFILGLADGTVVSHHSPGNSAKYLINSIMAFFSNAVLLYDTRPQEMVYYVDEYISETWKLYCQRPSAD
jgi:AcrR family transcriptional regulator